MAKHPPTRVDPPEWAVQPELDVWGVTVADYAAMHRHRDKMLRTLHKEVAAWLQRWRPPKRKYPVREWCPSGQPNGLYYIGDEEYSGGDQNWFQITIKCHLILSRSSEKDFLVLEVNLKCVRGRWATFEVLINAGS